MTDGRGEAEEPASRDGAPAEPAEVAEEPTQADDSTRLAARGLDQTRIASRGPAREAEERIEAPRFAPRPPETDGPSSARRRDTYAPRTAVPHGSGDAARPIAASPGTPAADGAGIVTPEGRADRERHDRWTRARRVAALTGGAVLAIGAAIALAVALL
ncbi:hypothetical protein QQX10_05655 [Demequina sp. SYSU T00039]|uniref:Uncharacterized protein n=1 Tax=Demequina lignilytica TaxID=3051663 RepID=A0AAW7M4N0_9MICO|nr:MULTISPECIES: hypothetical protein [unclassified Demequina]MDN4477743.1 hypothetical protein [Demequina sp. SYSU T00039-1]MDN4487652.1 hypothetical protein [Demequina sp. SYSU T00039]